MIILIRALAAPIHFFDAPVTSAMLLAVLDIASALHCQFAGRVEIKSWRLFCGYFDDLNPTSVLMKRSRSSLTSF
jgi:hypothetical protein